MVLLKRINEAKQVGTLYHICTFRDVKDYIIKDDVLSGSGRYYNRLANTRDVVSFTRNKHFIVETVGNYPVLVQFVVDGDKLSENYKVFPFNYFNHSSEKQSLKKQ